MVETLVDGVAGYRYFAGALLVDSVFRHATFCKYVCPIGQFNFVAALVSPLEVSARDHQICSGCGTRDCIKGRRGSQLVSIDTPVIQRGCELALFQPGKASNMDSTFCLDCVYGCPHENEMWKVHLLVYSGGVTEHAFARVEATPTILGSWELLLYALPFVGVGFLWFNVAAKRRRIRKRTARTS